MIGRIYVVNHYSLLHTKYISSGPHGFRIEDFLSKPMGADDRQGAATLEPRGMVGRIYVGDQLTALHTLLALGLMVSDFLRFFSYIALYKRMTQGAWPVWTPGP